jgi:membrane protein required for colicin V production
MHANWADYSIAGIIFISALIGLLRGFIKEILSLIIWGASFYIGFKFCEPCSYYFSSHITNASLRISTAFIILFTVTIIIGSIISHLITNLTNKNSLKSPDRALGMFFGIARGILVTAVLLLLLSIGIKEKSSWQKKSYLAPKFKDAVDWMQTFLPNGTKESNIVIPTRSIVVPAKVGTTILA